MKPLRMRFAPDVVEKAVRTVTTHRAIATG
jgi:hypothetical protein